MTNIIETALDYYGDEKTAYFSSSENKWIKKVMELKEKYPEEVKIKIYPEDNDGCLCAVFPKTWFRISPPKKMELTEEDRLARRGRAKAARDARANKRGA